MTKRPRPHIPPETRRLADKARSAALVIGFAFASWMLAQVLGQRFGWPIWLAFAFDAAAFIGLFWGLMLTYQIYRERKQRGSGRNTDRR